MDARRHWLEAVIAAETPWVLRHLITMAPELRRQSEDEQPPEAGETGGLGFLEATCQGGG